MTQLLQKPQRAQSVTSGPRCRQFFGGHVGGGNCGAGNNERAEWSRV
jgi:hypothetical protein